MDLLPKDKITIYPIGIGNSFTLPIIKNGGVTAGFPSPAGDYLQEAIDLNSLLIQHPSSTFIIEVSGKSMTGAFIADPSLLIVDRAIQPNSGDIILAVVDNEFTVKYLERDVKGIRLIPANKKYKTLEIVDGMEFLVWGTVTRILIDPRKNDCYSRLQ